MEDATKKYHIKKNTIQETLIIPLYGRKVCSDHFPELFKDEEAERICSMLDYDFTEKGKKMEGGVGLFGALEVAQRQFDLSWEVKDYLKNYPEAAVVNLGCGLDDTFRKCNNGKCRGYNIDMPDVIKVRDEILPATKREQNVGCNLNDFSWMDMIDGTKGAIFFASGVFYYFQKSEVESLLGETAKRFPNGVVVFDSCNKRGAKMMTKTWIKEAGISNVDALFSVEDKSEIESWSNSFDSVTARSYMRGYRDIYKSVGMLHKIMIKFCDNFVNMQIIKVSFKKSDAIVAESS